MVGLCHFELILATQHILIHVQHKHEASEKMQSILGYHYFKG